MLTYDVTTQAIRSSRASHTIKTTKQSAGNKKLPRMRSSLRIKEEFLCLGIVNIKWKEIIAAGEKLHAIPGENAVCYMENLIILYAKNLTY